MTQTKARRMAIFFAALWLLSAWLMRDRYPTLDDCVSVADGYAQRGLLDETAAGQYARECREAGSKDERRGVVGRMNDQASENWRPR